MALTNLHGMLEKRVQKIPMLGHGVKMAQDMITEKVRGFLDRINTRDCWEFIESANQEATRAERAFYRNRGRGEKAQERTYADRLKRLIYFVRYGIKPRGINAGDLELLHAHGITSPREKEG